MDIENHNTSVHTDIARSEQAIEDFLLEHLGAMESFSEVEKKAIVQVEKLRATSRAELSKTRLRSKLIGDIIHDGSFSVHPNGYKTLEGMAQDVGISLTQLSNLVSIYSYVIPYLQSALGMSEEEFWQIPKSNMNDVLPHLRMLISGEESKSSSVRSAVNRILEEVVEIGADDPVRSAVESIIEIASTGTNRAVRQYLNPDPTPNIDAVTFEKDDTKYIVARCTEDQWIMFQRLIGSHIDIMPVTAESDVVREIAGLF